MTSLKPTSSLFSNAKAVAGSGHVSADAGRSGTGSATTAATAARSSHVPEQAHAAAPKPRVVVLGLASCFGCQLQITNMEAHLIDVLSRIDLSYWQLATSDHMPDTYDVAVIEGAVTTREALELVREVRAKARTVITIGACAMTAGIPGMAAEDYDAKLDLVYGAAPLPAALGEPISPRSVPSVIDVDYSVPCCPIDGPEFLTVLSAAISGSNRLPDTRTMCGSCKQNGTSCFYDSGTLCLGLVTRAGCHAKCVNLGRPCNGCRGLSPDANVEAARACAVSVGIRAEDFDAALKLFNRTDPRLSCEQGGAETCEERA